MMLERRPNDFAHRNLLLQALVGLESVGGHLDDALARFVPQTAPEDPAEADDLVHAIVGLVALRAKLGSHLDAVEPAPSEEPPLEGAGPRELLR